MKTKLWRPTPCGLRWRPIHGQETLGIDRGGEDFDQRILASPLPRAPRGLKRSWRWPTGCSNPTSRILAVLWRIDVVRAGFPCAGAAGHLPDNYDFLSLIQQAGFKFNAEFTVKVLGPGVTRYQHGVCSSLATPVEVTRRTAAEA